MRQLLAESVLLAIVSAALGWWLAKWVVRAYELTAGGSDVPERPPPRGMLPSAQV